MDYLKKQYNKAQSTNNRRRRDDYTSRPGGSDARAQSARSPPVQPPRPAPPASAFDKLQALSSELRGLVRSFEPPSSSVELEWQIKKPGMDTEATEDHPEQTPKLAFNTANAPVHAYEDALMKLLIKLDGVESEGDMSIRDERKRLVREVEKELARLDEWRSRRWQQSRDRCVAALPAPANNEPRFDDSLPRQPRSTHQSDYETQRRPRQARDEARSHPDDRRFDEPRFDEQPRFQDRNPYAQYQRHQGQHSRDRSPPRRDYRDSQFQRHPQQQRPQQDWRDNRHFDDDRWARPATDGERSQHAYGRSRGSKYDQPRDDSTFYRHT